MKRVAILYGIIIIFLLAGCNQTEKLQVQDPIELKTYRFHSAMEVEQMSDEDLIYINQGVYKTADFYEEGEFTQIDFFDVKLDKEVNEQAYIDFFKVEDLEIELDVSKPVPEEEFDRLVEEDIQSMYYYANSKKTEEKTGDVVVSKDTFFCGENDLYAEYSVRYTQRRTMYNNNILVSNDIKRAYRQIYLKNYLLETNVGEWRAYLLGELSADYVKEQLDVFYYRGIPIIYREVIEEEDCYIYSTYSTFYEYGEMGVNNSVILRHHTQIVDKNTHLIIDNAPVEVRRVVIEGTEYDVVPIY